MLRKAWNAPAAATAKAATVCVNWLPAPIPSPSTRRASPGAEATGVAITVGELAELPVALTVAGGKEVVEVSAQAEMVETSRSSTTDTIGERRIDNLPINGRNYIQFTLTDSQVQRDSAPDTGAAPTSGLNMSGQRARSNLVNVDGADATDNSTNGVRSTVSQEAVQEFQIITNSYAAEYGRASGGVVNIITRSGSNDFHGDVYGYLRNRNFQAVNPFSTTPNPAYTRVQAGVAFGGPIKKDKTYYYFAYEITRRHETGFSSIGQDNFGLTPFDTTPLGLRLGTLQLTPDQIAFLTNPTVRRDCSHQSSFCLCVGPVRRHFRRVFRDGRQRRVANKPRRTTWLYLNLSDSRNLLRPCLLPDAGLAGRQLPRLRRHQPLLAAHRSQHQQQQPPHAARQRQSQHGDRHRSQRTRPALRSKRLLAHFSANLP